MLTRARRRSGVVFVPVMAEAAALPLRDDVFDAVLHFGALNAFSDPGGAIDEMLRVAAAGAWVVVSDKCLPPPGERLLREGVHVWVKPQVSTPPPIDQLPVPRDAVEVDRLWGDTMYRLRFRALDGPPAR